MKVPRQVDKLIKKLNHDLPARQYQSVERVKLKGSELIAQGVKEIEGKQVDLMGSYTRTTGRKHNVNHKRRMRKAFKNGGAPALTNYIKQFVNHTEYANLKSNIIKVCTA